MPSVHIDSVSFAHTSSVPLFDDVSLTLGAEWYGLVGANGAGKTTLLRIIAGEMAPDTGTVRLVPDTPPPVLCPQTVEHLTAEIAAFAESYRGGDPGLRGRLGLEADMLDRWKTLSPGERKRWQIGAALAADPLVLLLDEPTNHLDGDARALLVAALKGYGGVGIVVSHDRGLLDELTSATIRLHRSRTVLWRGGYTAARTAWQQEERERTEERSRLVQQSKALRRRLADERRTRDAATRNLSTRRRMSGPKDHDATSAAAKNRTAAGEQSLARRAKVTSEALARVDEDLAARSMVREKGGSVFFDYVPAPKRRLVSFTAGALAAGDTEVLRGVSVEILREDRIRIAGRNGAGKSTLLAALMDAASIPADRILHLPQELTAAEGRAVLDRVRALPGEARGRVLSLVALLGADPDLVLASDQPSPGEARKLAIAFGLGTQVWAIALDEPTNHLDLPSIERLEEALTDYPGALLLITHDDTLADAVTDTTWLVEDGRLSVLHQS